MSDLVKRLRDEGNKLRTGYVKALHDDAANEIERLSDIALERGEALERARGCIKGLLARTPVRDVEETLAEIDAALRGPEGVPFGESSK